MKKMVTIWIIIFVILTGTLLFIGYNVKSQNKDYQTLENDLIEAGDIYLSKNNIELKINETKKMNISDLIEENLISLENVEKLKCDGYVTIKKKINGLEFSPYIKCDNYETME